MSDNNQEQPLRINKYLTLSGIDSRRVADDLIAQGRVSVNGTVITQPGMKIESGDFVRVDDKRVEPLPISTVLLNKPRDFVCSRAQQGETNTIYSLLPHNLKHLTYAGRLDADSEGLLIMTNDGDLIQKLTHPTEGIEKEYWVTLDQSFDNSVLSQLLRGVTLPEGHAKAKYVSRASARRAHVVLEQGLKRQVRQMFSCLGLRVTKLVRVRIGSLWGGDLEPGRCAHLSAEEIALALKNPPAPKDCFVPEEGGSLLKHKPGRVGGPLHPGQIAEREESQSQDDSRGSTKFGDEESPAHSPRREGFGGGSRGGFGGRREGGFGGGFRRDRDGDGESRPRRSFGDRKEGFGGRREGGFGRDRDGGREGGFKREGGFGGGFRRDRDGDGESRPRRSFGDRQEGFGGRREGGFGRDREGGREGGFGGGGGFRRDREGGGFGGGRSEGFRPRRDNGFGGDRRRGDR